jgi:hypothetical protein
MDYYGAGLRFCASLQACAALKRPLIFPDALLPSAPSAATAQLTAGHGYLTVHGNHYCRTSGPPGLAGASHASAAGTVAFGATRRAPVMLAVRVALAPRG